MKQNEEKCTPGVESHLSSAERMFSVISGSVLLVEAIRKKSVWRGVAAGYALARGIVGLHLLKNEKDDEPETADIK